MISLILSIGIHIYIQPKIEIQPVAEVYKEQPLYTGTATWYDYTLNIDGEEVERSKEHRTCALRIYERYKTYRVCSVATGKCVECYHNDYGPKEYTNNIIDLSSYAFKQLGIPLSRGVADVEIYLIE